MDLVNLASGDKPDDSSPNKLKNDGTLELGSQEVNYKQKESKDITPQSIEENEVKLTERIVQFKNIIESLKIELNEEKAKLEREAAQQSIKPDHCNDSTSDYNNFTDVRVTKEYNSFMDEELSCDVNIMAYEKQLQKYQQTLNMAQIEKKNAIRKQMLTKACKLKLLEVENQCNIELLRVKQSLQCLEPLQMIASQWKLRDDESTTYDLDNFELIPRYPELGAKSSSDTTSYNNMDLGVSGTNKSEASN